MTPKQARFVEEYLIDGNGAAAARRAGYSPKRADQLALQTLRNAEVQAALKQRRAAMAEKLEITAEMVLRDLIRLGEKAENVGEFAPALKARELLGKHLGMFKDRVELTGKDGAELGIKVRFEEPGNVGG